MDKPKLRRWRVWQQQQSDWGRYPQSITQRGKPEWCMRTSELPFLALQYNIPKVDDLVVVACFSNGTVSGVILGPVYNSANTPHEGGAGIFRQEMSNNVNEAVMSYSEKKQTIILRAPKIEFEGYGYEDKPYVTLEQINDAFSDIDDNKTGISNLQDDTAKTKGKPSLQAQLDALEKRVKALGG